MEHHANWVAYAVAVVAQLIVGYIWFHPAVMGKVWAKANGVDIKDALPKNAAVTYGLTILLTLLFTLFIMNDVTRPGQDVAPDGHSYITFQHGIVHAILLSIFIMIPVFGTPALFEKRGWSWFGVQLGYWFLRMAAAAGILSAWR